MLLQAINLDFYLRAGSMVMLVVFFVYTLVLSKRAGESGIEAKKKYFLAFSFFFLMYALNYLQTELTIWHLWTYPDVIPSGFSVIWFSFINPADNDVFLFLFFFLGAAPLAFAIEKYLLMHKRVPLTILVVVALILTTMILFFPVTSDPAGAAVNYFFANLVILTGYLATIATVLTVLIIYMRIAVISTGKLRAVGFLMFFGLIFQVAALFLSSMNLGGFVLSGAELAHLIGLFGFILIFISIIQMR